MPDVVGVELKGSVDHLESLGFAVAIDESKHRRSHMMMNDFVVIEQDPVSATELAHGEQVHLAAVHAAELTATEDTTTTTTTSTSTTMTEPTTSTTTLTTTTTTTMAVTSTTTTTAAPPPLPPPPPTTATTIRPQPSGGTVHYKNCTEARAAGVTPIHEGEPGYARHLDRDGDGVGCE